MAPAGDWCALNSAIEAGCDSLYFGVKGVNMRALADNFDILEIKKVMELLRKHNVKGYLALNVIAFDKELDKIKSILEEAKSSGVDAIVLWDMGVLNLAKEMGLNIHLSTQASVSNIEAVKFYVSQGVKRIIMARECELRGIKKIIDYIQKEKIDCQIEAFIHGAMCVSISGRCFMSQEFFKKSANRGECLQPCRREYLITDIDDGYQYILGKDYVLSPKDLCTIDYLDRLIEAGIHAFKIEGRMRSPEYVKVATSAYRKAIDSYFAGDLDDKLKKELKEELKKVYNKGFSEGFYLGVSPLDLGSGGVKSEYKKVFLGEVIKFYKRISVAEINIMNEGLEKGQEILFMGKNTPASFAKADDIEIDHQGIDFAEKGKKIGVKVPFNVKPKDKVFILRKR